VLYTCVLWKLLGKYFSALFPLFFRFFVGSVRTVFLYVQKVILVVRTIRLIRLDVNSSCLDERVFAISIWHDVRTSLKFHLDGESCRVKSLSPRAAAHFFTSFGSFLSSCAFFLCFLREILKCKCHPCDLSPPQVCF
jgi:hypothetical protein